jgi:hypothetical protein
MAGVWLASATSNLVTSCENFIVLTIRVTRLRWMSFYRRRAPRMFRSQARIGLVESLPWWARYTKVCKESFSVAIWGYVQFADFRKLLPCWNRPK